jgi:hypothetical protein
MAELATTPTIGSFSPRETNAEPEPKSENPGKSVLMPVGKDSKVMSVATKPVESATKTSASWLWTVLKDESVTPTT